MSRRRATRRSAEPRARGHERSAVVRGASVRDAAATAFDANVRTRDAGFTVRDAGLTVRDAGLTRRSRRRRRRPVSPLLLLAAAAAALAFVGWALPGSTAASRSDTAAAPARSAAFWKGAEPERDPTPLFAQEGDMPVHLVIDPSRLTALAFHQASGDRALHLQSLVPDADMALATELKAVPPVGPGNTPDDTVWGGTCLRLWRSSRSGEPDTAVDMGADPGTPVWAPVSGTVVEVKPYLLYDKYEDFEIHIRPDGRDDVDVVLIHVQDVSVTAGDRVEGGVTQLASVRMMSDKIDIQLGGYTANGGDHVHVQVNRLPEPGELAQPNGS